MKSQFIVFFALAASTLALGCGGKQPAIQSFVADQDSVVPNTQVQLSWQDTDATSLSIDNSVGDVTGKSGIYVTPELTTTFTLTATNGEGKVTAAVTVTVTAAPATVTQFSAKPDVSTPGAPVTLQWVAQGAVALTLTSSNAAETLPTLAPTDSTATVRPQASTAYKLTVTGPPGTNNPAPRTASVIVEAAPTVVLSSSASVVTLGTSAVLSWTGVSVQDYTLVATPQAGGTAVTTNLGTALATHVRPLGPTTYTVRGLGAAGTGISNPVTVTVTGTSASGLAYTKSTPATGDVLQIVAENSPAPVGTALILDVKAIRPFAASAFAIDIPLDGSGVVGSRDGSARATLDTNSPAALPNGFVTVANGLDVLTADLNPGAAPFSATAALPASGPLAGVLTIGVAKKPGCKFHGLGCAGGSDGDATVSAGEVLARIRLQPNAAGGAGNVFAGSSLAAAGSGYRVIVRNAAGASVGTIAIGSLDAN